MWIKSSMSHLSLGHFPSSNFDGVQRTGVDLFPPRVGKSPANSFSHGSTNNCFLGLSDGSSGAWFSLVPGFAGLRGPGTAPSSEGRDDGVELQESFGTQVRRLIDILKIGCRR